MLDLVIGPIRSAAIREIARTKFRWFISVLQEAKNPCKSIYFVKRDSLNAKLRVVSPFSGIGLHRELYHVQNN